MNPQSPAARWQHRALEVLCAAFICRVLAQAIQYVWNVSWWPDFDVWHSGALPYGVVFAAQIAIVAVQIWAIARARRGLPVLGARSSRAVLAIGGVYFSFVVLRLLAGATFANGHTWFDAPIPSAFHLVLAAFVIISARQPETGPPATTFSDVIPAESRGTAI